MGLWETLAGGGLSVLTGGLTGLLGTGLTAWKEVAGRKLDLEANAARFAHEERMVEAQAQLAREEWAARTRVAQVEAEAAGSAAEMQLRAESYRSDGALLKEAPKSRFAEWLFATADWFRAMTRPSLTIYLVLLTTLVYWQVQKLVGGLGSALTAADAVAVLRQVLDMVLFLTATAVTWWFGSRAPSPRR